MAVRCSVVFAVLLLTTAARGAERNATFRVGVQVVQPFAVSTPAAAPAPTRGTRGSPRDSFALVASPAMAPGGAVLAGMRGAIQLPCGVRGCTVLLSDAGADPTTVMLTVFPDGAPVALVER